MVVRYRHKKKRHIVVYAQPQPRLEASNDFVRVDDDGKAAESGDAKAKD